MTLRLRNVTFMTADPERLAEFWALALRRSVHRASAEELMVVDDDWSLPRYTFQRVADAGPTGNRVHVDITADDRGAEVARLVGLGATEGATHGDDFRWTVLRDPDGNEFCVTDP